MRVEIEISEDAAETFGELAEDSELSVSEYVSRAVESLAGLASGDIPGYALAEFLVDPPEFDDDEDDAEAGEAEAGAV